MDEMKCPNPEQDLEATAPGTDTPRATGHISVSRAIAAVSWAKRAALILLPVEPSIIGRIPEHALNVSAGFSEGDALDPVFYVR